MSNSNISEYYKYQATLGLDEPSYVERNADTELYQKLKEGKLCYVFNSRKMGKSSLEVRVRQKLKDNDIFSCALIDLSKLGSEKSSVTIKTWYYTIYKNIAKELNLELDQNLSELKQWWNDRENQTYTDILGDFFDKILTEISQNILIVFDEIDSVLSLGFPTDDFFAFIRSCDNKRANNPESEYSRLNFCLVGTAIPSDLISDDARTPFNIGGDIELAGFTFEEAQKGLKNGLIGKVDDPDQVLQDILIWTNGQPFLTQKLCDLVVKQGQKIPDIDNLVQTKIINDWESNDKPEYLRTISARILNKKENKERRLILYSQIREQEAGILADHTPEQDELCLSGIVIKTGNKLRICNKICWEIFNLDWIKDQIQQLRPYPENNAIIWAKDKDKTLLLSGQALQDAIVWEQRMGGRLSPIDTNYLTASKVAEATSEEKIELELQRVSLNMSQRLLGKISKPETIVFEILEWTNKEPNLTKIICEFINVDNAEPPIEGSEKDWFENWLQTHIIENWQNSPIKEYLLKMEQTLLASKHSLWRLNIYQQILHREFSKTLITDENDGNALNALLAPRLIVEEQENFRVANRIYESIFNQQWLENHLPPYAQSFMVWSESKDESLLINQDLDQMINWLHNKERLNELDYIIHTVVWSIWQSAKNDTKTKAVEIIKNFYEQQKDKTDKIYSFLTNILKFTSDQTNLLEKLLTSISESEDPIPEADQEQWIKQLIQSLTKNDILNEIEAWMIAYEKAIVKRYSKYAKVIIDKAFCEVIETLTQEKYLEETENKFETIEACIQYLSDNLVSTKIWNTDERPIVNHTETENVLMIQVSNCSYQQQCQWALQESAFTKNKNYRCQRLGSCVGAVKKYISTNNLPKTNKEKLDYLMTTVIDEREGCKGFIFIDEDNRRKIILNNEQFNY